MNANPVSIITIASEQVLPQLVFAVHFLSNRSFNGVLHVIYTNDHRRSQVPAKLLVGLLKEKFPQAEIRLAKRAIQPLPEEVVGIVKEIIGSAHPDTHWIMNATGGTKLMSAVLIEKAGQKNVTVVYQELSQNKWYQIKRDSIRGLFSEEMLMKDRPLSGYSIPELLRTQLSVPDKKSFNLSVGSGLELDFFKFMNLQIKYVGNYFSTFQELNQTVDRSKNVFEMIIYNMVKSFGLDVVGNVVLSGKDGKQYLQEIDVIANNGHKLIFIDCKLRTAEEEGRLVEKITSQIRQAVATRNEFGGLGAEMILLRPNRVFKEDERELCQLHKLKFIESSQVAELMPHLYGFCTGKEPDSMCDELRELQGRIEAAYAKGNKVFFQDFHPKAKKTVNGENIYFDLNFYSKGYTSSESELIEFIHNFSPVIELDLGDTTKKWSLSCLQPCFFLLIVRKYDPNDVKESFGVFSENELLVKIINIHNTNKMRFVFFRLLNPVHAHQVELISFFKRNKENYIVVKQK